MPDFDHRINDNLKPGWLAEECRRVEEQTRRYNRYITGEAEREVVALKAEVEARDVELADLRALCASLQQEGSGWRYD